MALRIRREVDELSEGDLRALRQGLIDLGWAEEDSTYARLVRIYGLPLPILSHHHDGLFLHWNRAYLAVFEAALGLPIPWWNFSSERRHNSGFPAGFAEETVDGSANPLFQGPILGIPRDQWDGLNTGPLPQFTRREPGEPARLPSAEDVRQALSQASYADFADTIEALSDSLHTWVGGTMSLVVLAAFDPLFWPMRAAFDRLWWQWQQAHPDVEPPGDLLSRDLPPFGRAVADVLDVRRLGYTYDSRAAAGAAAPVMAGYSADVASGPDSLGIGPDVRTLSMLLAARTVEPPISVGLFGDWGSGKTYFMNQMQQRIRLLAAESRRAREHGQDSAFCTEICQITFNAWHYADTDLWASLASHIFESLASPASMGRSDDGGDAQRAREEQVSLTRKLAEARVEADLLAAQATRGSAREELGRLGRDFGEAAVAGLVDDAKADLEWLGSRAGVDLRDATVASVDDVRHLVSLASLVRQLANEFRLRGRVVVVLAIALVAVLVIWLVALQVAGAVGRLAAPAVISFVTLLALAAGPLRAVAETTRRVRSLLARVQTREAERRAELERRREAAGRRIADLERDLAALDSGHRLYDFAHQRSTSSDYLQRIGLVGLIRRDFERMTALLSDEAPRNAGHDPLPTIDRIVLYIDDLDRCSPAQVVRVLEAVHLLLAMPLFAVVVGVDVRWLLLSLRHRYALEGGGGQAAVLAADTAGWSVTAMNYLEKIFQIPYTLRPMDAAGFGRLIERLVPVAPAVATPPAPGRLQGPAPADGDHQPEVWELRLAPVPAADEQGQGETVDLLPPGLVIESAEQSFLKLLGPFVPTPRAAKRVTNVYRLIRASLDRAELDRFARSGDYRVVLTLLAVMVGHPRQAAGLFQRITAAAGDLRWRNVIEGLLASSQPDDARLAATLDQLAQTDGVDLPNTVRHWQRWVHAVGRYSFEVGHRIDVTEPQPAPVIRRDRSAGSAQPGQSGRVGRGRHPAARVAGPDPNEGQPS